MKVEQLTLTDDGAWSRTGGVPVADSAGLVFAFLQPRMENAGARIEALKALYPHADIVACSSSGHILGTESLDNEGIAVAAAFDATPIRVATAELSTVADSRETGRTLGDALKAPDLAGVFVLSEGLNVNGTDLVEGLLEKLGPDVALAGGLAGDGDAFTLTRVGVNGELKENCVAAVGFYGPRVRFACGYAGGWEPFGPQRKITRSNGNVLYELDGKPALDLYKRYLGPEAHGLPASGLHFPLHLRAGAQRNGGTGDGVVRTVLAVDETEHSLTFAGDVPSGDLVQLMTASTDRLITGAAEAGSRAARVCDTCQACHTGAENTLALFVSCVGRKLLLGQRASEEVEAASATLPAATIAGFYSYGEISPDVASGQSELHNQTLAITVICEM